MSQREPSVVFPAFQWQKPDANAFRLINSKGCQILFGLRHVSRSPAMAGNVVSKPAGQEGVAVFGGIIEGKIQAPEEIES